MRLTKDDWNKLSWILKWADNEDLEQLESHIKALKGVGKTNMEDKK